MQYFIKFHYLILLDFSILSALHEIENDLVASQKAGKSNSGIISLSLNQVYESIQYKMSEQSQIIAQLEYITNLGGLLVASVGNGITQNNSQGEEITHTKETINMFAGLPTSIGVGGRDLQGLKTLLYQSRGPVTFDQCPQGIYWSKPDLQAFSDVCTAYSVKGQVCAN